MQLNRRILNWDLKDSSNWLFLISGASRFHASSADMAKQRRPKSVAVEMTTRSPRVDDRSLLLALIDDTGWQKSARYRGARPRKVL